VLSTVDRGLTIIIHDRSPEGSVTHCTKVVYSGKHHC